MNRRDTILIAVLINMALLAVLFLSALKPTSPLEIADVKLKEKGKEEKKIVLPKEPPLVDQVDAILSKFVENEVVKESKMEPPLEPKVDIKTVEAPFMREGMKEIIVRSGDVLDKIARQYNTNVETIKKINNLSDSKLQIGQILYIPETLEKDNLPKASSSKTNFKESEMRYYIVKHGDNPWTIAVKNGIKVEDLLRLNNLDENRAKKLRPGDRLRIQ